MARRPRLRFAGVAQHVTQRGNNRRATFFAEEDYVPYLKYLREAARRHGCATHAYVLITNHVHLLASSSRPDSISLMMRKLGRQYVQNVNAIYRLRIKAIDILSQQVGRDLASRRCRMPRYVTECKVYRAARRLGGKSERSNTIAVSGSQRRELRYDTAFSELRRR